MKRYENIHKGVVRLVKDFFVANPYWGGNDSLNEARLGRFQLLARAVAGVYDARSPIVHVSPACSKYVVDGRTLVLSLKLRNIDLFCALGEYLGKSDPKGWGHSLYRTARPELYEANFGRNRGAVNVLSEPVELAV